MPVAQHLTGVLPHGRPPLILSSYSLDLAARTPEHDAVHVPERPFDNSRVFAEVVALEPGQHHEKAAFGTGRLLRPDTMDANFRALGRRQEWEPPLVPRGKGSGPKEPHRQPCQQFATVEPKPVLHLERPCCSGRVREIIAVATQFESGDGIAPQDGWGGCPARSGIVLASPVLST